jgi:hypothetical protein
MFALIVLMLATPILTDRHAAMAQKDIRNAGPPGGKGGVTKAGAENQKLSKPNAASAPNLLQSPIEKGTSASTSPNAPKAIAGTTTVSQLQQIQSEATPGQAKDVEKFIEQKIQGEAVPNPEQLESEKIEAEQAGISSTSNVKVVEPALNLNTTAPGPSSNSATTNATSNETGSLSTPSQESAQSGQSPTSQVSKQFNSFDGIDYAHSGGWLPPDPTVAVGPQYALTMVNNAGAIYTKSGGLVTSFSTASFFGTGNHFIFDPVVIFDYHSQRYFAIISDGTANQVRMFVSNSNNPLGGWHGYWMNFAALPDQARITVSTDKIAIVASDFGSSGFIREEIYWWGKAGVVSGGSFVWGHANVNPYYFHLQPAIAMTPASGTANWWVYSPWNGGNFAIILRSDGPANAINFQALYYVPMAPTAIPPSALQYGTTNKVNTNDARVGSAAINGGNIIWTQNDRCTPPGDNTPRSCIRWDIVTTSGYKLQDIDIGYRGAYLYFGATAADYPSQFGVIFGFSSPYTYPSAAFAGQSRTSAYGTVDSPVIIRYGTGPETSGRHGDYASLAVDFFDPNWRYWGIEEYNRAGSLWNTVISQNDEQ